MSWILREFRLFCTAILFLSRIPVPSRWAYGSEQMNASMRYLPLTGFLLGALLAFILWTCHLMMSFEVALGITLALGIWITGAMHEDGFADFCDGYGGGYHKERILSIMKDSHMGVYGSVGLIVLLGLKFLLLSQGSLTQIMLMLFLGHGLSRMTLVLLMSTTSYARHDSSSKVKAVTEKRIRTFPALYAVLMGIVPLFCFVNGLYACLVICILLALTWLLRRYVIHKTDGYTGDVLGALQEMSELSFYLVIHCLMFTQHTIFLEKPFSWLYG